MSLLKDGLSTPEQEDIKPTLESLQQHSHPEASTGNEEGPIGLTTEKVAEVFLTASIAFQKIGELAAKLRTPISENVDETKWDNRMVEELKEAIGEFAQKLDSISEKVESRTLQLIKTDIKRKSIHVSDRLDPLKTPLSSIYGHSRNLNQTNNQLSRESTSGGSYLVSQQSQGTRLVQQPGGGHNYLNSATSSVQRRYVPYSSAGTSVNGASAEQKRISPTTNGPSTVFRSVRMPPASPSVEVGAASLNRPPQFPSREPSLSEINESTFEAKTEEISDFHV